MKPTVATLKAFIRKNRDGLLVRTRSQFDGMIDGCRYDPAASFSPAKAPDQTFSNNLGIAGVWLVGGSRDRIQPLEGELGLVGFRVYNCCGSFDVAVTDWKNAPEAMAKKAREFAVLSELRSRQQK